MRVYVARERGLWESHVFMKGKKNKKRTLVSEHRTYALIRAVSRMVSS